LDSDVGREGEEGYELREMGSDGQGGVDGSAGGGVSATAAAMERSIDRSIDRIESKAIETNELFALLLVLHSRCGTHRVSRSLNDAYMTR
jgi:hypothetical protein